MHSEKEGMYTGRTYVAVCYILGFRQIVSDQPLKYLAGLLIDDAFKLVFGFWNDHSLKTWKV